MFQFHTGSIKREAAFFEVALDHLFQFHTGSIKSSGVGVAGMKLMSRFNSILVRLKDACPFLDQLDILGFNSILVRLKVSFPPDLPVWFGVSIPYWFD